jgi:hypothetical protein
MAFLQNPFAQQKIKQQIQGGLQGVRNYIGGVANKLGANISSPIQQPPKQQPAPENRPAPIEPRRLAPPAPNATGEQLQRNLQADRQAKQSIPTPSGLSDLGGFGGGVDQAADAQRLADEQEAQRQANEEKRLIAEQEAKNESFRQQLGGQYGDIKSKFGNILGTFNEKLSSFPNAIRQLNQQYKASIGEKEGQEIGQVGQKREQVAQQQKSGLSKIQEDVARNIRQGASRLGSLGMASSAAGMFQKAIQNAANSNAQNLLTQAANNYQQLDAEEARVKSSYKTMRDELDAEEANKTQDLQKNVNSIIADINERLQKSGEFERMDKEQLNTTYINELTNRFEEAKQASESYKQQLEEWRRENESRIRGLKDRMVQDFIPKEIQGRELAGINQGKQQQDTEAGLNLRRLRRLPEDNEEAAIPSNLQQITRRLRQNINQ